MRIFSNYLFEGLRFLEEDGNIMKEVVWDERPGGVWTIPEAIPSGHHIIGIEVSIAEESGLINYMDFITGPISSKGIADLQTQANP